MPILLICPYCGQIWGCIPGTIVCEDCLPNFCKYKTLAEEEIRVICKACVIHFLEIGKIW